ncbi:MAG: amino acid permease [Fimbriimonadales bacterium]|nr:amino acid permease [Fimbriimonadales bacterium]
MPIFTAIKRLLIGAPIATAAAHHQRIGVFFGLALLASDNISVVAYASEEILHMLALGGHDKIPYAIGISFAIVALIVIILFSYSRTIMAYPQGGGDYRVASDNISSVAGRTAGAALLLDYTLTVAVSVSAGVLAIVSAFPQTQPYIMHMNVAAIALLTIVNLRGTKESGVVFAIPTYTFVALMFLLIAMGMPKLGIVEPEVVIDIKEKAVEPVAWFLILRAFAAGCAALTGIEAIANGTMIFRAPEVKNALRALVFLGIIVSTIFIGVSWLATHYPITIMSASEPGYKTVLSQVAQTAFGGENFLFYAVQLATMAILILAANTAYADFPRLTSFIAKDGYLPRQLANLGDRLVFQNGIILLAFVAVFLIFFSGGDTHRLIPLYALGVFTAFTLGQAGMVVRQWKQRAFLGASISTIGMTATGTVWFVILITKFLDGAWMIVIALGTLLTVFWAVRRHYNSLARQLTITPGETAPKIDSTVLLLLPPRVHKGILQAIGYARTLSKDLRAVTTVADVSLAKELKVEWERIAPDIPLVILESPYRSIVEPVVEYIDAAIGEDQDRMLTVIVPEAIAAHWWQRILHNNSALPLKLALASRKNVVITNVRYFLNE